MRSLIIALIVLPATTALAQCTGPDCITIQTPRIDWAPQVSYEDRSFQVQRPAPMVMDHTWRQQAPRQAPQYQQSLPPVPQTSVQVQVRQPQPVIGPRLWQGPIWAWHLGRYRVYWR